MRILLAEDDYASRKFATNLLHKYGEVDATVNGDEAVSAVLLSHEDEKHYDLICLDIMMPGTDGIEALYQIRELEKTRNLPEEKRSKIIMISALSEPENVDGAFSMGCDGYANKPLDCERFDDLLRRLGLIGI